LVGTRTDVVRKPARNGAGGWPLALRTLVMLEGCGLGGAQGPKSKRKGEEQGGEAAEELWAD